MFLLLKRLFDIILSTLLIFASFPFLFFSIILVLIIDNHFPLFLHERSGKNGKIIKIIKLRTMKERDGVLEITKLGKFFRISKIDELPQILNILLNDMSFIGPRPLFLDFNNYYKKHHKLRISVKPGLTGLAQIKVKDNSNWSQKFNFDVIYIKHTNFKLELYILYMTFLLVLKSLFQKESRPIEIINYKKHFFENYQ